MCNLLQASLKLIVSLGVFLNNVGANSPNIIHNSKLEVITLTRHNHVSLLGPVNKQSIDQIILDIDILTKDNFYVYLNSPGGLVTEGERLVNHFNYLQETGKNITCLAENAHSMAFYIFQNCNQRYIMQNSKVMQHQMTVYNNGPLENLDNYLVMIKKISHRLNTFCAQRIGISLDKFNSLVSTDWWLYGLEIIDQNVADRMVLVGCEKSKIGFMTLEGQIIDYSFRCPLIIPPEKTEITISQFNRVTLFTDLTW